MKNDMAGGMARAMQYIQPDIADLKPLPLVKPAVWREGFTRGRESEHRCLHRQFLQPECIRRMRTDNWNVVQTGDINRPTDMIDIGDITQLIDYLWISNQPLPCPEEANMDGDVEGLIDITDITYLIDYLWITNTPLAPCRQ